jgi:hypothetical protein
MNGIGKHASSTAAICPTIEASPPDSPSFDDACAVAARLPRCRHGRAPQRHGGARRLRNLYPRPFACEFTDPARCLRLGRAFDRMGEVVSWRS